MLATSDKQEMQHYHKHVFDPKTVLWCVRLFFRHPGCLLLAEAACSRP